jgi:Sugar-transfer associated ATP-grasp
MRSGWLYKVPGLASSSGRNFRGEVAAALGAFRYRWWTFFYKRCLTGFPWYRPARPPGVPAMVAARRIIRRDFGRDHHPLYRALAQVLVTIAWPPAVLFHIFETRYRRGPDWVPIKWAPEAIWAAMRHNVLPGEYFAYSLWRSDRKSNIDNYLYAKEGPRLFKLLNQPLQPNPIEDKLAFHDMCQAHALPNPRILAAFAPTGKLLEFETGRPPEYDLFVKPRIGLGSEGAERFRRQGGIFESSRGFRLGSEDLNNYLAARARMENRTLLVQPALSNHPALHVNPNAALATARLVTGVSTDGNVFPICSFIYFAQTDHIPANYVSVALIDVMSGRLMSAPQALCGAKRPKHQLNSNSNEPYTLPEWETALRHVKVAHQACSNFVFIGWDVVFTDHGPMLLEGNANWCADEYQRLSGKPLGFTKFADILAARLCDLL